MGGYVVRELLTHGHAVSSLDATQPGESLCPTYNVDLRKLDLLLDRFKNVDAVVHLARVRFPYTEIGFNVDTQQWEFTDTAGDAERFIQNVAITNNVLAAAQACHVRDPPGHYEHFGAVCDGGRGYVEANARFDYQTELSRRGG